MTADLPEFDLAHGEHLEKCLADALAKIGKDQPTALVVPTPGRQGMARRMPRPGPAAGLHG
jgi:hypothetical protein